MTDTLPSFNHDKVDRTVLLRLFDDTAATLDEAMSDKAEFEIHVSAGNLSARAAQAAFFAAVGAAERAAGKASVSIDKSQRALLVLGGPHRGKTVEEALDIAGITVGRPTAPNVIELLHGPVAQPHTAAVHTLRFWWEGWIARVQPGDPKPGMASDKGNVLAAIAAGALAVHEAFGIFRDTPGRDDGYRPVVLNLWNFSDSTTAGPQLAWAPNSWWLVGLGHLGQANAWVLSWLGLPNGAKVVVQDDGYLSDANHSTGMLTPSTPRPDRKTRQAAAALDASGLRTRIIEDRYRGDPVPGWAAETVALFGVDDVRPRRLISDGQWKLAIDVGLGIRHDDFDGILLHRFPGGTRSDSIVTWQQEADEANVPNNAAFSDLLSRYDTCGVTELAGTAVGAAFVGLIAAVLAIAEVTRPLHEGTASDIVRADLAAWTIQNALSIAENEPAAVELETSGHDRRVL